MSSSPGLDTLKSEAKAFAQEFTGKNIPELYGVTDGKAVGTYVEHAFFEHLQEKFVFRW